MQATIKLFPRLQKSNYFLVLLLLNLFLLTLAFVFYNGAFLFWQYPLSYLGHAFSYAEGLPNSISRIIYGLSMFSSGVVMLLLGLRYRALMTKKLDWPKYVLCMVAALGFFVASFSPDDTVHLAHVLGSACFAFSLWLLATVELYDIRVYLGRFRHVMLQFMLQIPAIYYAFTYFADIAPLNYIVQKFAFLCLIVALAYVCFVDAPADKS